MARFIKYHSQICGKISKICHDNDQYCSARFYSHPQNLFYQLFSLSRPGLGEKIYVRRKEPQNEYCQMKQHQERDKKKISKKRKYLHDNQRVILKQ